MRQSFVSLLNSRFFPGRTRWQHRSEPTLPEHLIDPVPQRADDLSRLWRRRAVGGHQHNHAANRPGQHSAFRHRLADARAGALAQLERLAPAPVTHEFDTDDEADLPDVADIWQ